MGFCGGHTHAAYDNNDGSSWRSADGSTTWTGPGTGTPTLNAGGPQTGLLFLLYHVDIQRDSGGSVTLDAFQDSVQGQSAGRLKHAAALESAQDGLVLTKFGNRYEA
jgi:hypothetical protein